MSGKSDSKFNKDKSEVLNGLHKVDSVEISEDMSNLLDKYDIDVLSDHLDEAIKKNSKLRKKNKKLANDLELMTRCFVEMVEKNDRLEDELKNIKKEVVSRSST